MINIYIRIWSILRTFYFLEKIKGENTNIKFENILSRWNMGDDSQEITFIEQEILNTNPDVLIEDINTYSKDLLNELGDLSLSILYKDIKNIVLSDGDISQIERKCLTVIEKNWSEKLVDVDDLIYRMCNREIFVPDNYLIALGFLFLIMIKSRVNLPYNFVMSHLVVVCSLHF